MDTAKFGYLGAVLGTGHAPGEPLYLMINAAWVQLLPFGEPAWRANLLSAVVGVLACLVLIPVLRELGVNRWMASVGAGLIGVSRLFWQQSIVAEVYSLNALFFAVELCLLLAWLRTRRDGLLLAGLGAYLISFSNHPTGLLLLPGIVLFLIATRGYRVLVQPKSVVVLICCALVALSTYAYIVWRSLDLTTAYLEVDIHDWGSFWAALTGQQYRDGTPTDYGPGFVFDRLRLGLLQLWQQYFILSAVGIWGVLRLLRRSPHTVTLTLPWGVAVALFATVYSVSDFEVFYMVAWIILGLWITVGMSDLVDRIPRVLSPRSDGWTARLPLVATILAPFTLASINYPVVDLSNSEAKFRYSTAVDNLPHNSVVFTSSYLSYHGLNYFLLPGGSGTRNHQYIALGSIHTDQAGEVEGIDRVAQYCAGNDDMWLPRIRTRIPSGLHTFIYPDEYAKHVAARGYDVRPVSQNLYHLSCQR